MGRHQWEFIMNPAEKWKILLVDDERHSREAMADWLESEGFDCVAVSDGKQAIEHIHDGIAVIVTDLKMPRTDGLELLRFAKQQAPHVAVILVSGYGTVDTAVAALKEGAFDFLAKPINAEELTQRIRMALQKKDMATEIARLHAELNDRLGFENIVGNSPPMRAVFERVRLVADTRSTVLVVGESGTGKELVAHAIHQQSSRRERPFVPVNCAAIPETLVESELFGYEKGAFTGATGRKQGLFQTAEGGTLFIDEIGELPTGLQAKLLRALENRKVMPVGSTQEVKVDVRLVAATNRDLHEQVQQKQFREDLYYRLKVVELELPPLRERCDDIPLLVRYFVDQIAEENGRPTRDITPEALEALNAYDWPGNVRELRNLLESIIVLSLKEQIELSDLPEQISKVQLARAVIQPGMTMAEIEKEAIRRTLEKTGGRRGETAEILGISVRTLHRKIKEYDLPT
jgi:DNA-binding NtrC family response regulator